MWSLVSTATRRENRLTHNKEFTKTLVFGKIKNDFDEKIGLVEKVQSHTQELKIRLTAVKPKKRMRVEMTPSSGLADIEAIRRAQQQVKAAENKRSKGT